MGPREPGRALASVTGTVFARNARGPVPTWVRLTVIGSLVAGRSGKTDRAMAHVPVVVGADSGSVVGLGSVDASAAVPARRTRAGRLCGRFASDAFPLAGTRAAGDGSGFLRKQHTKCLRLDSKYIILLK